MPFKLGAAPIRRTAKYLEAGRLVFKETVQIMTVNYNVDEEELYFKERPMLHPIYRENMKPMPWWMKAGPHHRGAQEFVFWDLPQIQYKNPSVQMVTLKNLTPSPFVTCYLEDGSHVIFDVDSHSSTEIVDRLVKTLGKTKATLEKEAMLSERKDNPANFGKGCERWCICENEGQVPCPGFVPVPKHWFWTFHHRGSPDDED